MRFLLIIFFLLCFTSCDSKHNANNHPIVGTTQTLKTKSLITEMIVSSKEIYGVDYSFFPINSNNDWRTEGWLSVGTEIYITKIDKRRDNRGEFIVVFGTAPKPGTDGEIINFVYNWSIGLLIKRAPWENESVPESGRRDVFNLKD